MNPETDVWCEPLNQVDTSHLRQRVGIKTKELNLSLDFSSETFKMQNAESFTEGLPVCIRQSECS